MDNCRIIMRYGTIYFFLFVFCLMLFSCRVKKQVTSTSETVRVEQTETISDERLDAHIRDILERQREWLNREDSTAESVYEWLRESVVITLNEQGIQSVRLWIVNEAGLLTGHMFPILTGDRRATRR